MLAPARHVADLARSAATRGSRARDDAEAPRELESQAVRAVSRDVTLAALPRRG